MTAPTTFSLALPNETATAHLMADLALLIGPGDVITLSGDLGAGKTAAARAMIRYLADDDALEVPSPTFTLAQSYDLPPFPLVHADLYRVNDPTELEEIGLSPLPEATVVLIEWPERAAGALPEDRIDIALSHRPALGSARAIRRNHRLRQGGRAGRAIEGAAAVSRRRRLSRGQTPAHGRRRLDPFLCAADPRRRRRDPDEFAAAARWPRKTETYAAAVHLAEDVKPFVAIANGLRERGFSAPAIHHADLDAGFLITEDFGSEGVIEGDPPARSRSATRPRPTCWRRCIASRCRRHCRWRRSSPMPFPFSTPMRCWSRSD